jgi:3-hydroxyisobutyrate dehydrogenase-like beta-hydroxyacid dehydrogenase
MPTTRVAVLGCGEAGTEVCAGLVAAGVDVRAYDPVAATPRGVSAAPDEAAAVAGRDLVVSLTTAEAARGALKAALPALRPGALWADLNTSGPDLKLELAALCATASVTFADVAVMCPVPGRGVRLPLVVSGDGAASVAGFFGALGATVEILAAPPGVAATRKLLRSIFYKGTATAIVEALRTAAKYGLDDWLRAHIAGDLAGATRDFAARLESGSYTHARRRAAEMTAAAELVTAAGLTPHLSLAARDLLRELAD